MADKYFIIIESREQSLAVQARLFDSVPGLKWIDGDAEIFRPTTKRTALLVERDILSFTVPNRDQALRIHQGVTELDASEIIQGDRHPFECTMAKEVHPSEWDLLPDGIKPLRFLWGKSGSWFDIGNFADWRNIPRYLRNEAIPPYSGVDAVEFSNGWVWEAKRGWRKKGVAPRGTPTGVIFDETHKEPPNIHEIIARECDPYGRNDHPALMEAHFARQRPEKWSINQEAAVEIVSAAKGVTRLYVGDERTDAAVDEQ